MIADWVICTGWGWDEVRLNLDLPRMFALQAGWQKVLSNRQGETKSDAPANATATATATADELLALFPLPPELV